MVEPHLLTEKTKSKIEVNRIIAKQRINQKNAKLL